MTATVSKAGPYYTSGEIKFSSLRSNFRAQVRKETSSGSETFITDNNEIKASDFRRNILTDNTNPIVPNASENSEISTSSNWKTSQFRNSIKYYYIAQSDDDDNFDIVSPPSSASWNGNLDKNIQKFLFVDGICGSVDATKSAMQLNSTAYNLTIDVSGSILGAGGVGGGNDQNALVTSGQNGGDALNMSSPNGKNNIVLVRRGSQIYGGGGGGEKGSAGAPGNSGSCYSETTYQGCGEVQSCPDGYSDAGTWGGRCCESTCDWCFGCCERCTKNLQYRSCYKYTGVTPGLGGEGGAGGYGRGSNNLTGTLIGYPGGLGQEPSSVTSTISYNWTTDGDDAYLNVTGIGRARITVEINTQDKPNIAGTSYGTIRIYDGPNTGFSLIQTWGFDNGIRRVSFDVTAKTYMVRISDNPRNVQIESNFKVKGTPISYGVKLRDNDGDDANAAIYVNSISQYTISAGEACGATRGSDGDPGGSGGEWASAGSGTLSGGGGGGPGRAIFGSNYSLSPNSVINSLTIKGVYK